MNRLTLERGDRVYLQYGCMCGDDLATVVGKEETRFDTNVWVRLSDFTLTTVSRPLGVVTECDGVIQGATQIGSYLVKEG